MSTKYDAIVIGAGQAGPPLAARLDEEGQKTALIERKLLGGTCVNTGCIPTKALVASAQVAHLARRAGDFGVSVKGDVGVDMAKVKARKDAIVQRSRDGLEKWMGGTDKVTLIRGQARFTGPKEIAVGNDHLSADRIFINVGARANVPDMPGLEETPYLTNSSMMEVDFLPRHLAIVGGSYIGLEFAQIYRRFGSEVTVVEMKDRLIPREDPEVSDCIREILEAEGVALRLNATCLGFKTRGKDILVSVDCSDGAPEVAASHLLLAVGRTPNTADLGLDAAGVEVDKRGFVRVDEELRTSVPGIWALGECNGRGAFTHTSYNDYEIVAANLFDKAGATRRRVSDRITAYGLFTDPPLGHVGMSEAEARSSGRKVLVGRLPMKSVSRARLRGETAGFMKILVDGQNERILGAAMIGIEADELVQLLLPIMQADLPYTILQRTMFVHPTVSEYLPTLVGDLEPLK
jgi:pyruvate/2-oxoglutarate dehydrogenase complex dihydrolipoamide dehydrogenase (E3) component